MIYMDESILTDVKKILGISEEDSNFDRDVLMHINTYFMVLEQLGINNENNKKEIDEDTTWGNVVSNFNDLQAIKTYISLRVKLVFDPPSNSFTLESMKRIADELEWRLNISVDPKKEDV